MAVKRIFNIKNLKSRTCLKCNRPIERFLLKDNKLYKCKCGQVHFVDIYEGGVCTLTVEEKPQLRRRRTYKADELLKATKEAAEWKKTAEDLAKVIEEIRGGE